MLPVLAVLFPALACAEELGEQATRMMRQSCTTCHGTVPGGPEKTRRCYMVT